MSLSIDIPHEIEAALRQQLADLDGVAKKACLVELYRQGQLTHHQLAAALGIDRYSTDGLLMRHGVGYELSAEELQRQFALLAEKR